MICEQCKKEGRKSRVYAGTVSRTLMGRQTFWDEEGIPHVHDPNTEHRSYSCSRGHSWTVVIEKIPCPTCGIDWRY